MKIKVLIVSFNYNKESPGGAAKSFLNIVENLKELKEFEIETLTLKSINKNFNPFGLSYYLYIINVLRKVNKIKPHIMITQTGLAFVSILASRIKNIPIINIIRDNSLICPKFVDIVDYGISCSALIDRKTCYKCINYWRSLSVFIGDNAKGRIGSFKILFSTIAYKLRYFICRINIFFFNRATVNLVASPLMKSFLSNQINPKTLEIINITPIKRKETELNIKKKKQFIFIIPSYKSSHKGLDFILRLSKNLPENYKILIVGNKLAKNVLEKGDSSKITNLGHVKKEKLDKLYKESVVTLVPSFYNEAFGRIVVESILNGTQVVSSPQCGASSFFRNDEFLQIQPLKLDLWTQALNEMISNPYNFTKEDVDSAYDKFSMEKNKNDFKNLIKSLISNKKI
jgi:glycosyltransferase involved in cell wall biosynthesis